MADDKHGAQDVPAFTPENQDGQLSLFDSLQSVIPNEKADTFHTVSEIMGHALDLMESGDNENIYVDFGYKLEVIRLMLQDPTCKPYQIAQECRTAAIYADKLYDKTQIPQFKEALTKLLAIADQVEPESDRGKAEIKPSVIHTATGKEFVLPDDLEEYRKDNPIGAIAYEIELTLRTIEKQAVDRAGMSAIAKLLHSTIAEIKGLESGMMNPEEASTMPNESRLGPTARAVIDFAAQTKYRPLRELDSVRQLLASRFKDEIADVQISTTGRAAKKIRDLLPFIAQQLDDLHRYYLDPRFNNCTLQTIVDYGFTPTGKPAENDYGQVVTDAAVTMQWFKSFSELSRLIDTLSPSTPSSAPVKTSAKRIDDMDYPLDKLNSIIWGLGEDCTDCPIPIKAEKHGSGKEINILYSISFEGDGLKISKKLDAFDKRVYIAIAALFKAGNKVISLTQIHYAMGNTTRPKKEQLQRINDAVKKMRAATITIDNEQESKNNYKYPKFTYDGSLLPLERIEASINGQLTEAAIHIFREPPVMSFATQRKQVTTIPVKLLQTPMNKTESNLLLENYLLERISRAKGGKSPKEKERILFETLYKNTNSTEKMQKTRLRGKAAKLLSFYVENNFINRYTEEPDGVTVYL